ncbi:MAG: phosphotransferase [Actinomycetota bacterium]
MEEILALVRTRHGLDFSLEESLSGGEGPGAYALRSDGGRAVLKFLEGAGAEHVGNTIRAVDELRSRGYPAPAYMCWGSDPRGMYVIQEQLEGTPIGDAFGEQHVAEVLRLNQLQADAKTDAVGDWPGPVVDPVLEGGEGYCLLETMRTHSDETSGLLLELQHIASTDGGSIGPRSDYVHFDFSQANILSGRERITGVIDWDAVCLGDRAFDLVTLAFYAHEIPEVFQRIWSVVLDLSGAAALRTYFAHMMLRQTEWSIRFHSAEIAQRYLDRSRAIMTQLGSLR